MVLLEYITGHNKFCVNMVIDRMDRAGLFIFSTAPHRFIACSCCSEVRSAVSQFLK